MLRLIVICALVGVASSQMVPQCTCASVEPCKQQAASSVTQCADSCQSHVSGMGAPYASIRKCILQKQNLIDNLIKCEHKQLANTCAATPGRQVPKRYPETLKLAVFNEITNILTRSGIQAEASAFLSVGKKFAGCLLKCMNKGSGNCFKKLGCGLALPPDNVIVQQTKTCAISSGFNSAGVQQLCSCIESAGVRSLKGLCNRIQIS